MFRFKNRFAVFFLTALISFCAVTMDLHEDIFCIRGDPDSDMSVTDDDVSLILKYSARLEKPESLVVKMAADVNDDGKITPRDAVYAKYASLGLISLSDPDSLESFGITVTRETVPADSGKNSTASDQVQLVTDASVGETGAKYVDNQKIYLYPDLSSLLNIRDTFIIVTYGYGHCLGMSQYGAVGMARDGFNYIQILQHYYYNVQIAYEQPRATVSLKGTQVDTVEMLSRIVQQEIAGLTRRGNSLDANALKAQAVAAYTNMKYSGYKVQGCTYVSSFSRCTDDVINAVKSVVGQFIMYNNEPIYAYYGAMSAGITATTQAVWGTSGQPYIANVPSYWDCNYSSYVGVKTVSVEQMRNYITSYDGSIRLSDDPSQWLRILAHDDAVNETTGYVYSMQVGDRVIESGAGMVFRDKIMDYSIKSPCFNIIYNGQFY